MNDIAAFCQVCGFPLGDGESVRRPNLAHRNDYQHYASKRYGPARITFDGVVCEKHDSAAGWREVQEKADAWARWRRAG